MAQSAPSIVFGSAGIASFSTETVKEMLEILEKHKITQIDTARVYVSSASSETVDGEADFGAARQRTTAREARRPEEVYHTDKGPGIQPRCIGKAEHS